MSTPTTLALTYSALDADGICASQSAAGAGNLTLDGALVSGGVAVLTDYGFERAVVITSAGNDSAKTFTIYGLNSSGNPIQQAVTGANAGAATSTMLFYKVTRVAVSAATASTVTVGTNGVISSRWLQLDANLTPFSVGIGVVVSGTINFTVQYTYDNIQLLTAPSPTAPAVPVIPTAFNLTALASKTANTDSSITAPVTAVRLVANSGTAPASASATVVQAGLASP